VAKDAISRKIDQAAFHLAKIEGERDEFAIECHFAALLACVRSCVFYAHEWQITNGKATNTKDYARIHAWEAALPVDDLEHWKALTRIRNKDIHEEPAIPDPPMKVRRTGPRIGMRVGIKIGTNIGIGYTVQLPRMIVNAKTGKSYPLVEVCRRGIATAKLLLANYETI